VISNRQGIVSELPPSTFVRLALISGLDDCPDRVIIQVYITNAYRAQVIQWKRLAFMRPLLKAILSPVTNPARGSKHASPRDPVMLPKAPISTMDDYVR
jgi:hypothetical protein